VLVRLTPGGFREPHWHPSALLMFNTSAAEPPDDIGLVAALNVTPRDVLGAVFGAPPEVFPQTIEPITITRRR
jgi:oxalate decarboxylase